MKQISVIIALNQITEIGLAELDVDNRAGLLAGETVPVAAHHLPRCDPGPGGHCGYRESRHNYL